MIGMTKLSPAGTRRKKMSITSPRNIAGRKVRGCENDILMNGTLSSACSIYSTKSFLTDTKRNLNAAPIATARPGRAPR